MTIILSYYLFIYYLIITQWAHYQFSFNEKSSVMLCSFCYYNFTNGRAWILWVRLISNNMLSVIWMSSSHWIVILFLMWRVAAIGIGWKDVVFYSLVVLLVLIVYEVTQDYSIAYALFSFMLCSRLLGGVILYASWFMF
jgi:hypothetical protein